jgi:hypothetical protein
MPMSGHRASCAIALCPCCLTAALRSKRSRASSVTRASRASSVTRALPSRSWSTASRFARCCKAGRRGWTGFSAARMLSHSVVTQPTEVAASRSGKRPLTWVGLRGLEPRTSSLSGKRSNRLSYRPSYRQPTGTTLRSEPLTRDAADDQGYMPGRTGRAELDYRTTASCAKRTHPPAVKVSRPPPA